MTTRTRLIVVCMLASALLPLLCGIAASDVFSSVLSFQGRLSAADGKPLPDGAYAVTFRMYAAASGGSALWTESQNVAQVGGTFTAYLGSVTAFPSNLFSSGDRWLGIQVGADPEISARVRLTPSPWAIRALAADGAQYTDLLDGQHGAFYQNASNLTLGTLLDARLSSNVALLNIPQTFTADKYFSARVGIGTMGLLYPLQVENSSDALGARAISGISTSAGSGQQHWGVYGETRSTDTSNSGAGVYGYATAGSSAGVRGETPSIYGAGVFGWASAPAGQTYGVRGLCSSPSGFAGYFEGRGYFGGKLYADAGLVVNGAATITQDLSVWGNTTLEDYLTVNGGLGTTTLSTSSYASVGGLLQVSGTSTLWGQLAAQGGITTTTLTTSSLATLSNLVVTSNATIGGTLGVTGATTLSGPLTSYGGISTTTLSASGNVTVGGTLNANGSSLTSLNASNLTTGTVNDARFSNNVALLNTAQTFTANKMFTGLVGIGTAASTYPLSIQTNSDAAGMCALNVLAAGTGTGSQVWAIYGETRSTAIGNAGAALLGYASASTGASSGVRGDASGDGGTGVLGYAWSSTGVTYGVRALCFSPNGYAGYFDGRGYFSGKVGIGNSSPTAKLTVVNSDTGNPGISSTHTATMNDAPAVLGVHNITDYYGVGVHGIGGFRGVIGEVVPTGNQSYVGVYGYVHGGSGSNYAVYGQATGGANSYGVYGVASGASTANYAGYFQGNVTVTGTLSKGGGSFKIDHPLDPENKYLSHSFVESPDMKNIYDGVVVTDERGYATITMPDWFEALNRDFRYQLTVIDNSDDFVMAKVTQEIEDGSFVIRTSAPNVKVSWMVTGIRQDAYANLHRIPLEEEKAGSERGKYLHPDAYGRPIDEGIGVINDAEQVKRVTPVK